MTREKLIIKLKVSTTISWYREKKCLEAVKRNGHALQYVKEQSEAVCLEAVKADGDALRYVNIKTFGIHIKDLEASK